MILMMTMVFSFSAASSSSSSESRFSFSLAFSFFLSRFLLEEDDAKVDSTRAEREQHAKALFKNAVFFFQRHTQKKDPHFSCMV